MTSPYVLCDEQNITCSVHRTTRTEHVRCSEHWGPWQPRERQRQLPAEAPDAQVRELVQRWHGGSERPCIRDGLHRAAQVAHRQRVQARLLPTRLTSGSTHSQPSAPVCSEVPL